MGRRRRGRLEVSVVGGLVFVGRNVVELAVQAPVVEPIDPLHRRVFDVVDGAQRAGQKRAAATDAFGLEQADCRLGQGIVVGVTDTSDGCCNALQDKRFPERDRCILRSGIAGGESIRHRCDGWCDRDATTPSSTLWSPWRCPSRSPRASPRWLARSSPPPPNDDAVG